MGLKSANGFNLAVGRDGALERLTAHASYSDFEGGAGEDADGKDYQHGHRDSRETQQDRRRFFLLSNSHSVEGAKALSRQYIRRVAAENEAGLSSSGFTAMVRRAALNRCKAKIG